MMHGNITRPTQDVDVVSVATEQTWSVSYALPQPLQEAVEDVAQVLDLPRDWLNTGALGIVAERLPDGFTDRLHSLTYHNLVVCVLDREDLLKLKVWAAADEGPFSRHTHDIRAIGPTAAELEIAFKWAAVHARASAADIEIIAQALAGAN